VEEVVMTETIELKDRLVKKARNLSGINDDADLINMTLNRYIHAEETFRAMMKFKDSDIIDETYNPKACYKDVV
jgi:hypothetical protein